ncbi:hypothetical protein A2U01_0047110, partial [Trifolium medium]|nr:hypothetical protein [Trifolium medium]
MLQQGEGVATLPTSSLSVNSDTLTVAIDQ